jgi:hypothetical protein
MHQHADVPHTLALLGARRKRPRGCRAAEKANDLTSPHICTKLRGQHCIGLNGYFDRAQTGQQNHCRSAQPMSLMGQKHALPRRSIAVRFTPTSRPDMTA